MFFRNKGNNVEQQKFFTANNKQYTGTVLL